jgi:hypothetical protein
MNFFNQILLGFTIFIGALIIIKVSVAFLKTVKLQGQYNSATSNEKKELDRQMEENPELKAYMKPLSFREVYKPLAVVLLMLLAYVIIKLI